MVHVSHVATAQDSRCYQVQANGQTLRLTWEQAKDLFAELGVRLAEQNQRIDQAVADFKSSPAYLYKGESPW